MPPFSVTNYMLLRKSNNSSWLSFLLWEMGLIKIILKIIEIIKRADDARG
jgi:hypothetical protein